MSNERKFVSENIKRLLVKEYIMGKVHGSGFGGMEIIRTPMGTRVSLLVERPGIVIGRKGSSIKMLTADLSEKYGLQSPQIEVEEAKKYYLNAQIMAEKLASALERGWKFRRAGHSTVRRIMDGGAKGCQVTIAGKLTGQRHRTAKFKQGHIKFCGEPSILFMDRGFAVAKLKPGVLGVTVWIMKPGTRLPDEVNVGDTLAPIPTPAVEEMVDKPGTVEVPATADAPVEKKTVKEVVEDAKKSETPEADVPVEAAPNTAPEETKDGDV